MLSFAWGDCGGAFVTLTDDERGGREREKAIIRDNLRTEKPSMSGVGGWYHGHRNPCRDGRPQIGCLPTANLGWPSVGALCVFGSQGWSGGVAAFFVLKPCGGGLAGTCMWWCRRVKYPTRHRGTVGFVVGEWLVSGW